MEKELHLLNTILPGTKIIQKSCSCLCFPSILFGAHSSRLSPHHSSRNALVEATNDRGIPTANGPFFYSFDLTFRQHLISFVTPLVTLCPLGFQTTASAVLSPHCRSPRLAYHLVLSIKLLLEHSHSHLFIYPLWLLSGYRGQVACKAANIYHVALYGESLLTPGIDPLGTLVFLPQHQPLIVFCASFPHLLDL